MEHQCKILYKISSFRLDWTKNMAVMDHSCLWTAWSNGTIVYRRHLCKVLYKVCSFWPEWTKKWPPWTILLMAGTFKKCQIESTTVDSLFQILSVVVLYVYAEESLYFNCEYGCTIFVKNKDKDGHCPIPRLQIRDLMKLKCIVNRCRINDRLFYRNYPHMIGKRLDY